MCMAMDVHEHGAPNKKGVFVDSRILALAHAWQAENPLPQFLMKFFF